MMRNGRWGKLSWASANWADAANITENIAGRKTGCNIEATVRQTPGGQGSDMGIEHPSVAEKGNQPRIIHAAESKCHSCSLTLPIAMLTKPSG